MPAREKTTKETQDELVTNGLLSKDRDSYVYSTAFKTKMDLIATHDGSNPRIRDMKTDYSMVLYETTKFLSSEKEEIDIDRYFKIFDSMEKRQ